MSHTAGRHDVGTDRRLLTLVGLIVVLASGVVIGAMASLPRTLPDSVRDIGTFATLIFMITLGGVVKASIRIRSTTHSIAWVETAVVIGVAIAPASWVVASTVLGVALSSFILRLPAIKSAFGIGKNVLIAGGTVAVASALDWPAASPSVSNLIGTLAIVYLVAALLDDLLAMPVIALASGTPVMRQFRTDLDLRVAGFAVRFLVAACTVLILRADPRLLLAVPALVLSLHLAYSTRIRTRTEQQAWQRLARATDALNVVDLDQVLTTAVTEASELFSADEIEIELREVLTRDD